jgi:chemotaxis protein MotB
MVWVAMDTRRVVVTALVVAAVGTAGAIFVATRGLAAIAEARALRAERALLIQAQGDTSKQATELRTELERHAAALGKAEAELEAAKRANIDLGNKLAGYSEELAHRQSELRDTATIEDRLLEHLRPEVTEQKISLARRGAALSVTLAGPLLFDSGQAVLTAQGSEVLARVGAILREASGKDIHVVGHTDNRPISGARQRLYPSNWELSTARAAAVVRFLIDSVGIAPQRCGAVGMGEFQPVASNDTSSGRTENRRIEILLVAPLPKPEPLPVPPVPATADPAVAPAQP